MNAPFPRVRSSDRPTWWAVAFAAVGFGIALNPTGAAENSPHPAAHGALAILEASCVECHNAEKTKGGLDLTTRDALLHGGETGEAVTAGKYERSLLYRMVAHLEDPGMPHKKTKLSEESVALIADWIQAGTPYGRPLKIPTNSGSAKISFAITEADRAHWAFQPVRRPAEPEVSDRVWPRTPIDRFILAAQQKKGVRPSPRANRQTLLRRVTLDLTGLPPTLPEMDAFERDDSPQAYAALIDRLLASSHYGERWGRHWLDLARFAESDGFEHDAVRAHAWRYRDYVVRAFNEDKPYDRFIREQIAGDEMFPGDPDALTATAFNLLGPDMVDSADQIQRRRNTLNDMTDTTALAFLGLTVGCARCHDHKFEPISQRDYYSLQAFFAPAKFRTDLPVPSAAERSAFEAAMTVYNAQTRGVQEQLADLEAPYRKTLYDRKLAKLSSEAQAAHQTPKENRTTEQENQIQETAESLEITSKELVAAMKKPDRDRHKELLDELKPFPKPKPLPATLALQNGPPAKTHLLFRGDYNQPGDEVIAGFPEVLRSTAPVPQGAPAAGSHRARLADWIASADHPLTARVMVNRIWQHHFGRGLASSPSDFGTHGQKPSHPDLLDWLAAEFIAHRWSVKHLHRVILLSATYQQSSTADPNTLTRDSDNRLYSRMNRLRLEGEVIRDSLLAISGQLNPKVGGPGVFPPIPKELFEGAKGWTPNERPADHARRSLYVFVRRNLRFPFLEVFDAPDSNLSCASRDRSTTAPQSLTLLNAEEVLSAAALIAQQIAAETSARTEQITLAYRLILGRVPTEQEHALSRTFLDRSPLPELCRALFNLNAFVYAE